MGKNSMAYLEEIRKVQEEVKSRRSINLGQPKELTESSASATLSKIAEYADILLTLLKPSGVTNIRTYLHDTEYHEYGTPVTSLYPSKTSNMIAFISDLCEDSSLVICIRPLESVVTYGASSLELLKSTNWDEIHAIIIKFVDEVAPYIAE